MPSLMQQLHDIEGLDAISAWPLAIGWWIVIAFVLLILAGTGLLLIRGLNYLRSWKRDTFKKLNSLEQNLSPATSVEIVAFLSEYLRRIAMRRFPRKECAGLTGNAWLKWLEAHDPKQFNWSQKGKMLIEVPYAPAHAELPLQQIKELIQAVRHWVC
jgi:hypothetical protein